MIRVLAIVAVISMAALALVARKRGMSVTSIRGQAKEFVGRATGDETMQAAGMADEAQGAAQDAVDQLQETLQGA